MQTVTISATYQVVIPRSIREKLGIAPGQKMTVMESNGNIEMIPARALPELQGFAKGIDTSFQRDEDWL